MKRGSHHNAAVRQRMSEARRKAWADPAVRQRMSEASRKAWAGKTTVTRGYCEACADGNCLACDGGRCKRPCSRELDRKRAPMLRRLA